MCSGEPQVDLRCHRGCDSVLLMNMVETAIPGVLIIEPKIFGDARGFFVETFKSARYIEAGIPGPFVQDNLSRSTYGVLRGLHLQNPGAQGKLVTVFHGRVLDECRGRPAPGQSKFRKTRVG
jgi:dTDP-4-dehydrorhamnose 3,5-epimerase-like enzyme